jgi:hypothetical protein
MPARPIRTGARRPFARLAAFALAALAAVALTLAAAPPAEAVSTRYEKRAVTIGKDMRAAYLDVKDMNDLRATDPAAWPGDIPRSEFEARGERLLAVAGRMNRLLADYGKAKTRYGNAAERRAVQSALLNLERARDGYSAVTGQGFDEPTAPQEDETRRLAEKVLKQIVARER